MGRAKKSNNEKSDDNISAECRKFSPSQAQEHLVVYLHLSMYLFIYVFIENIVNQRQRKN